MHDATSRGADGRGPNQARAGRTRLALKDLLGTLASHRGTWDVIPFGQLSSVHFARLVVFDEMKDLDGRVVPPRLVLLTDVDAPLDGHLRDLATICIEGLDLSSAIVRIFPVAAARTPDSRIAYLRQHSVPSRRVLCEPLRSLRAADPTGGRAACGDRQLPGHARLLAGKSSSEARGAIQEFVRIRPELSWALSPAEPPALSWRIKEALHRVLLAGVAVLLAPVVLVLLPFWLILLRRHEKSDVPDTSEASAEARRAFREDEDLGGQNQVIAIGCLKPGWFRSFTATAILRIADFAVRHIYNRGSLSGLNTIHFARWVAWTRARRMFFSSNYDGSLESYMNDFIDKAAWGLNAIFSNGDGFPANVLPVLRRDQGREGLQAIPARRGRCQSRVWYSAYQHLTTKNIANNAAIRAGLSGQLSTERRKPGCAASACGNQLPASGLDRPHPRQRSVGPAMPLSK